VDIYLDQNHWIALARGLPQDQLCTHLLDLHPEAFLLSALSEVKLASYLDEANVSQDFCVGPLEQLVANECSQNVT